MTMSIVRKDQGVDVLNDIFENCADYTRCPKCLGFGELARKGHMIIACTIDDCWKTLPRELLPSTYLLGLPTHDERRSRPPSVDIDTTASSHEIDILHQKIDRLEKLFELLIGVQAIHLRAANTPADPPNAS